MSGQVKRVIGRTLALGLAALMSAVPLPAGTDLASQRAPVQVPTGKASSPFAVGINSYLGSRLGRVTAAVFDLNTGRTWLLRPGDMQATASIVKVDILATVLAHERPPGGLPSAEVQTTAAAMIEESDNDAATDLWHVAGGHAAIQAFDRQLGMYHTIPSTCLECTGFAWPGWGLTLTTAADQVTLIRDLVSSNPWFSTVQRKWVLGLMEQVVSAERWGVSSGAPAGVLIALKNGWVPLQSGLWQIDSVGWVDGRGRDYIAAVLSTDNPSEEYGIDTVDNIGADLYAELGPA